MPSSVSPSDGGYSYYQKTISDLEDELNDEVKRAKERADNRAQALEESYKSGLEKRDRELESTVENVRKRANETIERDRENSKAELKQLKQQLYDRNGRFTESDRHSLNDLQKSSTAMAEMYKKSISNIEEDHEQKTMEREREYQEKLEKTIAAARDAALAASGRASEEERTEYQQLRQETQDRYQELDRTRMDELNFQRRQMQKAIDDTKRDYEHRTQGTKETYEVALNNRDRSQAERMEKNTQELIASRDKETKMLRDQLKSLVDAESAYMRDKSQGSADALREFENEWRTRHTLAAENYQRQIDRLKQSNDESDTYYAHRNAESLREKDAHFSGIIARQNIDSHQRQQEIRTDFQGEFEKMNVRNQNDRAEAKRVLDQGLKDADIQRARALENQARAYQMTIDRHRQSNDEKIETLSKALQERSTTDNAALISPAAEAAIRNSAMKEHEKTLEAEHARNQRAADHLHDEYANRFQVTMMEKTAKEAQLQQQHANERSLDQSRFLDYVRDTELTKDAALHSRDENHDRQTEMLNKNYSRQLERQRREYEEIIDTQRNDATAKIQANRQEAEFNAKMTHRAFAARQNELIREYDKKLADQKQQFETEMEETKSQAQQALREVERKNRLAIEEQARSHEQKITQLEAQQKERERYIAQNYEDELEKVKRSNALLIQKKS